MKKFLEFNINSSENKIASYKSWSDESYHLKWNVRNYLDKFDSEDNSLVNIDSSGNNNANALNVDACSANQLRS